jgi:hypothetical protein
VKVANLQSNPHVAVAAYLEDPEAGLIVEGVARLRPEFRSVVTGEFQQKYDWDLINDDRHDALIEVVPSKLIAWGQYGEGHWSKVEIQKVVQNGK